MRGFQITVLLHHRKCLVCKSKLPEGYVFSYCCNGRDCGCAGLPIDPWTCCKTCDDILHLTWGNYEEYRYMWE